MFFKVLVSLALVALTTAQDGHHATSYASLNSYNTHISHDYKPAAPVAHKIVAPSYHHAAPAPAPAPIAYEHVPVYHQAPVAAPAVLAPAPIAYKSAPIIVKSAHYEEPKEEHYAPAHYQFKYGVHDTHTHDIKEQEETREGDVVKGYYSLLQPDGRTRIVHYTADKKNGFQAQVEYKGHAAHPEQKPAYHH